MATGDGEPGGSVSVVGKSSGGSGAGSTSGEPGIGGVAVADGTATAVAATAAAAAGEVLLISSTSGVEGEKLRPVSIESPSASWSSPS